MRSDITAQYTSYFRSQQLRRCIEMYDQRRAWSREETESTTRHRAINWLSHAAGIDYVPAAELLADALAKRAETRACHL